MQRRPLYPTHPGLPVLETQGAPLSDACERCRLFSKSPRTDTPALGDKFSVQGGLHVVVPHPTQDESAWSSPYLGRGHTALRKAIEKLWSGSVVYDYALRCNPGKSQVKPAHANACRPYLAHNVAESKPARILAVGSLAGASVFGHACAALSMRRAYGYAADGKTLAVMIPDYTPQGVNRFAHAEWVEDARWALFETPPAPRALEGRYVLVEDSQTAERVASQLRSERWIVYDTETSGLMFDGPDGYFSIDTIAVGGVEDDDDIFVWPRESIQDRATFEPLAKLLETAPLVGHNLKYDVLAAMAHKDRPVFCRNAYGDTQLLRKMEASDVTASLDYMSATVGLGGAKHEAAREVQAGVERIQKLRRLNQMGQSVLPQMLTPLIKSALAHPEIDPKRYAYGLMTPEVRQRYCARDVAVTRALFREREHKLVDAGPSKVLWDKVWKQAVTSLAQVEAWGMGVDRGMVEANAKMLDLEMGPLERQIHAAGLSNPRSNPEKQAFLFEHLGLPVLELTKSGAPSTSADVLAKLRDKHPIIPVLEQFTKLDTIQSHFARGMLPHIRGDGRVHTSFRPDGTRTGRMSSSDPNLQNIPSRDKVLAARVKNCFIAPPGHMLIQLDYSQLEFRVAALMSKDPVLTDVFVRGLDLHRRTAELVAPMMIGKSTEEAQAMSDEDISSLRSLVKAFNFGLLYGMTDGTLAKNLSITQQRAAQLRQSVLGSYSVLADWLRRVLAYVERTGETWTVVDGDRARARQLHNIASIDNGKRFTAANGASNTPIQGTAAYFTLRSINESTDWLVEDLVPAKLVNTVHDSNILEAPYEIADEVALMVQKIMEGYPTGDVPLKVDIEVGYAWGAMRKVRREGNLWMDAAGRGHETLRDLLSQAA